MPTDVPIYHDERLDDLQLKGLKIIQKPNAFCFGTDAVLLAHFARAKKTSRVLDLGTGGGILLLLIHGHYGTTSLRGVEIQPDMAELARRNMALNGLTDAVIYEGDYKAHGEAFLKGKFDLVVANPPYIKVGAGEGREESHHYIARHEVAATLDDVVAAASAALNAAGRFCMVHHPQRLSEIILTMVKHGIEPKRLQMVQPRWDKAPNLMLIEGIRGGKSGMRMEPTLSVYDADGAYTPEMLKIYGREG
ncbi:MAG: methyltransferase domain-containing protein [Clostridiales bacterium]|nr:methyltransferase domain-containing protein [Clostridiales bacterium]